jgi:hypothetical protein
MERIRPAGREKTMVFRKARDVAVGDRFVKVNDPRGGAWVVDFISEPVPGVPHARLMREAAKVDRITVSVASLLDRDFFAPFQGGAPTAELA